MAEGKILTIAIPSYNVEKYCKHGLRTLADPRFTEKLEVLIINDGSTDRTEEVARGFVAQYPEIFRLINKANGGHGSVINCGIQEATGKYFRVLDGDDWVLTDNLYQLLLDLAHRKEDCVADRRCEVHMLDHSMNHIPLPGGIVPGKTYEFAQICTHPEVARYFMIHNISVNTRLLQRLNVQVAEKTFYEDSEYVLKTTYICRTICFLDMEIYQYLIGNVNQSVSAGNFVKRYGDFNRVSQEMFICMKAPVLRTSESLPEPVLEYIRFRCRTVALTQLYIALIYDPDRRRGAERARKFMDGLKRTYPDFCKGIQMRYYLDMVLHYIGVDYDRLQKFRTLFRKA